jgi:antitoxin VapB
MALNIDDRELEKLAAEIAKLTGESEEEAIRRSLRERRDRLGRPPGRGGRRPRTKEEMLHHLETEIWPLIPAEHRGRPPMTKAERAELLGYGPGD